MGVLTDLSYSKFLPEEQKGGEVFQLYLQVVSFGKEKYIG